MPETRPHHRRMVLRVVLVAELVIALVTGATVVFAFNHLDNNITTLPAITHQVKKPKHHRGPTEPINILVMGSDTRKGKGNRIDNQTGGGERSDTTILLHVSADRKTAYGVSLPRDTMVSRPACRDGGKKIPAAAPVMFNEAFSVGGPLCTVEQVEHITGIYIDHYVVVDFRGFEDMVDAVHGVEVCIPKEVDDPAHGIFLKAGRRLVSGREALNYVRERHVLSPNSDIGRMKRQQAFIASMIHRVLSSGTLANPPRLYHFLDAATRSVRLDEGLNSLGKLYRLARELKDIDLTHIRFVTVPIQAYAPDPNRLAFMPQAHELWRLIRKDERLGRFGRGAITAGDEVGKPHGHSTGRKAQDRVANGLCA